MINISRNKRKNLFVDLAPDLTPLIDVVFILIVFLILSFNSSLYSLEVNLPQDKDNITKAVSNNQKIAIYLLSKEKVWKIDKTTYNSEAKFRQALKKIANQNPQLKIMIISDQKADVAKLVNLLTFLEKLKIKKINIAVEKI